jgi:hypothetical protein
VCNTADIGRCDVSRPALADGAPIAKAGANCSGEPQRVLRSQVLPLPLPLPPLPAACCLLLLLPVQASTQHYCCCLAAVFLLCYYFYFCGLAGRKSEDGSSSSIPFCSVFCSIQRGINARVNGQRKEMGRIPRNAEKGKGKTGPSRESPRLEQDPGRSAGQAPSRQSRSPGRREVVEVLRGVLLRPRQPGGGWCSSRSHLRAHLGGRQELRGRGDSQRRGGLGTGAPVRVLKNLWKNHAASNVDASWQISVVSTMSAAKHAKLAEYIQQHKKNWDLNFKVVMPGKAGKQLFKEYPLSDQSVVARAYGRKGGKAGKGKPKTGKAARGSKNTGKAAKGVKRAPNTGGGGQGGSQLAGRGGRRHADPAGTPSRLPAGGAGALKGVAGSAASRSRGLRVYLPKASQECTAETSPQSGYGQQPHLTRVVEATITNRSAGMLFVASCPCFICIGGLFAGVENSM